MSRINQIIELATTIKPGTSKQKFKLSAWPYSRTIVKTICEKNSIEYKNNRLNKAHEEFVVDINEKYVSSAELLFKEIIGLINKEATESGKPFTKERNAIVENICEKLGIISTSIVKEPKIEKPIVKKTSCPVCHSDDVTKNGKVNGFQKYKCKDCGTNFKC